MSCNDVVCGTAGYTGPKPGDPDNNIVLTARSTLGGVDVEWTYPSTNPHAVSYVILHRGTSDQYYQSVVHKIVSGNSFFDKMEQETPVLYYYWIRVVSINGTTGEPIGPASAYGSMSIGDLIDYLSGQISQSALAQDLAAKIEKIELIERDLAQEALDRLNSNSLIHDLLAQAQQDADGVTSLILNETVQRETAISALTQQFNFLYAQVNNDFAGILEDYVTTVDLEAANAALYQTFVSEYGDNTATLLNDYITIVDANAAIATAKTEMQTQFDGSIATALTNYQTISAANSASTSLQNTLQAYTNSYVSSALTNYYTKSQADSAVSTAITNIQVYDGMNLAQAFQSFDTWVGNVEGKTNTIGSQYMVKVGANNVVGGFGLYNDGATIDAGFDVDRFWIGKSVSGSLKRVYPFFIEGNTVYMNNAAIKNGSITSAKIGTLEVKTANIDNLAVQAANIGTAAVETLKIKGNAVTIPVAATGSGVVPSASMVIDVVPCKILIIAQANWLAYPGAPEQSAYLATKLKLGNTVWNGAAVGISLARSYSGSAMALGIFDVATAGTYICSLDYIAPERTLGTTGVFAMGIKR